MDEKKTSEQESENKDLEPEREAHIALRRARIQSRRLAKQKLGETEDGKNRRKVKNERDSKDIGKAKLQIAQSKKRLENVKASSEILITDIASKIDNYESSRRVEERFREKTRAKRVEEEKKNCDLELTAVAQNWPEISLDNPYKLHEALQLQLRRCQGLLESKNRLISENTTELKGKDDEYVQGLKLFAEQIDLLLERMEKQHREYQGSVQEEIELIEKAFMQERSEMLEMQSQEMEGLFQRRRSNEIRYMESRTSRLDEHSKILEASRIQDAEEYNMVKIKMETDVQILEQQLQQMRATYQLNSEKIDYNHQVLKKRNDENAQTITQQRKKITRLSDTLNNLRTKALRQERSFQQENISLSEDYRRISEQFKEIRKKLSHFQHADNQKFKDVWKTNEEEVQDLLRKLVNADRVIHEQQLGISWNPPKSHTYIHNLTSQEPFAQNDNTKEVESGFASQILKSAQKNSMIKDMLKLLSTEADFLVDEKLSKLLSPLHSEEQTLMRLDSIFKAIYISSQEDIQNLAKFFFIPSKDMSTLELIHPSGVNKALRAFVESQKAGGIQGKQTSLTGEEKFGSQSPSRDFKEYWMSLQNIIDDKKNGLWNVVFVYMQKYNCILSERHEIMQTLNYFDKQNENLRMLLRQYMTAKINAELVIPPTKILLGRQEE